MDKEIIQKALTVIECNDIDSDEFRTAVSAITNALGNDHFAQLEQLVISGPVWDGDVLSKSHCADLADLDLACRVVCRGEREYTAAKHLAIYVLNSARLGA